MEAALVADLCRSTLALSYPDEVEEVDAALARFGGGARRSPPVAMGVQLLPLADHLFAALMFLTGAAATHVAERGVDAVFNRVREFLGRRFDRRPPPPISAQDEQDVVIVLRRLLDEATPEEADRIGRAFIIVLRDESSP
ncbi:hypothetical protein [Actinoplanes subglobosus]|uniref:Uncharacterized protein n=1 Tax=Actinoplanes subglobosus TaxID=1547892 RepID=A0ABV8J0A0_9ACTN